MLRDFALSFFLYPFYFLIIFIFSSNKIHAQSSFDIILVQVPALIKSDSLEMINEFTPMDRYAKNTRIIRLSSRSNQSINLTADFYAAADPDISFDGKTIIFAGKKEEMDRWQIWRMKHDGSEKTQITKSDGDCFMPVHAGSRFYLNDPQPTPQIIYSGTEHNWRNLKEKWPVLSLYGIDLQGNNTHRLTFNLYSDYSPDILPDGRIVYTSWQESSDGGKYALMGLNIDGTDLMSYYGNHDLPIYKEMIHISDMDQRVYFIETDLSNWLGGGDIAFLSQIRPLKSYKKLTTIDDELYHSPCPLPNGGLLSSYRRSSNSDVFALYHLDPETGEIEEQIYKESGWHSIDTQILTDHPKAKGRSNWLIPGEKNGIFYCLDSYRTNIPDYKQIEIGLFKYIRVLEGLPLSEDMIASLAQKKTQEDTMNYLNPRRILGVVPVEPDGSFHIRVPAETPLNFQLLDENHMSVARQEAWTWVMGNENRGCIGCHEDRELSPPNILVAAVTKPAVDLSLSADKWKTVDFQHQVAPIIRQKCATDNCHVTGKILPDLEEKTGTVGKESSQHVFEILMKMTARGHGERYIIPGNAKASPLIRHLFEMREISNKKTYADDSIDRASNKELTEQEQMIFVEWIDTGAFWDLSPFKMHGSQEN